MPEPKSIFMALIIFTVLIWSVVIWNSVFAQQPPTPCEEVRGTLAVSMADAATRLTAAQREIGDLKAKLSEMEKKAANGKDATPDKK